MPKSSLVHIQSNMLCAVDCATTGLVPGFNDIIQVCLLPLDSCYRPLKVQGIVPYYTDLIPKRPENVDDKINRQALVNATLHGLDPYRAADLFDEWFQKLNLPFNKRIVPLAYNWPFDREFIIDWLGRESFNTYFDSRYRDPMVAANFLNDIADINNREIPYPKTKLSYLCSQLKIEHDRYKDCMDDCVKATEVYKRLISSSIF